MSDDQDKDSKTESPSEKKMSDAIEKGNTPFSREVTMFASVVAIYIFIVFFLPQGFATVAESLKDIFEQPEAWRIDTSTDVVALISHLFWKAGALLIPFFALLIVFGIGSSILQNLPTPGARPHRTEDEPDFADRRLQAHLRYSGSRRIRQGLRQGRDRFAHHRADALERLLRLARFDVFRSADDLHDDVGRSSTRS